VLVLIRPADAPQPHQASLWSYFTQACSTAWTKGITLLADTLATLLAVLLGGLFWWVLLTVVIVAIRCWRRRASVQADQTSPDRSA